MSVSAYTKGVKRTHHVCATPCASLLRAGLAPVLFNVQDMRLFPASLQQLSVRFAWHLRRLPVWDINPSLLESQQR